jgi:hypothetical protein
MINLNEEDWFIPGVKENKVALGKSAIQIALIVDGEIASFIGVDQEIGNLFLNSLSFVDIGEIDNGFFKFKMDNEEVISNEKIYSIMLSSPEIVKVDINIHRHADKAEPGWLYVDGQFIVPGVYE